MSLRIGSIAGLLALILALPAGSQTPPQAAAVEVLSSLTMRVAGAEREFRAIAPFRGNEFLAASFTLDGPTTSAMLHRISADGQIGAAIPLPKPQNYPSSRIDRLIPVGNAVIGIGHLAGGPEDRRGWIVRIEPDLSISAQTVLPVATVTQSINYYYGGVLDNQGRLVVAGRADQPDFPGIGVRFGVTEQGLLLVGIAYPGSPAVEAGMRPRDVILRANGRDLRGLNFQQAMEARAGPAGATLDLVIDRPNAGQLNVKVERRMVTGVTTGVVAVLNPTTLDIIQNPVPINHATYRAGLQDIGMTRDGRIVGVGWWESVPGNDSRFDKVWIVGFDAELTNQADAQFGRDGSNSIAQRVHLRPDGRFLVIGGMNAAPEPLAFASELTLDQGTNAPARLSPLREYALGPGRSDVFRGIATLGTGGTVVAGAFRSDNSPSFAAGVLVLGSPDEPMPIFPGCTQSYVWDMASTPSDALAIAGYCVDAQGERSAALMWSPPRQATVDTVAVADAPRVTLTPADGNGQSFDLAQSDNVMVFVPAGASGVLSLSDADGQLVDFATVDEGKAGLLTASLAPGRYMVGWTSADSASGTPRIEVMKASLPVPEPGLDGNFALAPDMEKALALLGYSGVRQQAHETSGAQSMALTRDIAAFQLAHNLPALGHIDVTTEVALSYEGALQAEAQGQQNAALARKLAELSDAEILPSRFGPVKGHWRGDAFVGHAVRNSLSYAGQWELGVGGQVQPSGVGVLENLTSRETFLGTFGNGGFSGLGVVDISRDRPTRFIGTFDEGGRFIKGAVFESGRLIASGKFAPGGRSLLQEVPLAR